MEKFSSPIEYKPNSPLDFTYCLQLVWDFAEERQAIVQNNSRRDKMAGVVGGEWDEVKEAREFSSWDRPSFALTSELADVIFGVAFYGYLFLPEDFNYERADRLVDNKIKSGFVRKVEKAIEGLYNPFKAPESSLFLIAALKTLSLELPKDFDLNAQVRHTAEKNGRNYPEKIFSEDHPWFGKLDTTGLQQQYDLGKDGMGRLRVLAGKPKDGITEDLVDPYTVLLRQIDRPVWALKSLDQQIKVAAKNGFFQANRNFQ